MKTAGKIAQLNSVGVCSGILAILSYLSMENKNESWELKYYRDHGVYLWLILTALCFNVGTCVLSCLVAENILRKSQSFLSKYIFGKVLYFTVIYLFFVVGILLFFGSLGYRIYYTWEILRKAWIVVCGIGSFLVLVIGAWLYDAIDFRVIKDALCKKDDIVYEQELVFRSSSPDEV